MLCHMKSGDLRTKKISIPLLGPVSSLLKEASQFSQASEEQLVLTYQGKILNKNDKLEEYNVADGGLILVTTVIPPSEQCHGQKVVNLTPEDTKRCVIAFKTALKSPSFSKVVKRLVEKENMENLCAACPGLEEDQLAQAFLTKPDLLSHLCDPEVLKKMSESHPCLLEAANNLAAAVHEEQQSSGRTGASSSASQESSAGAATGGSYYLDEMSDDEMDTEDGGQQQRSRRRSMTGGAGITPSQLAQALAMASGIGQGGANFNPFAGVTGLGVGNNQQEQGQSGGGSAPSSASARITANMFQQAMQQALQSAGGAAQQPPQSSSDQSASDDIAAKVERMKEMGIIDEGLALQALQIMGGDLQAAVDLIFSGWEGGDESMS